MAPGAPSTPLLPATVPSQCVPDQAHLRTVCCLPALQVHRELASGLSCPVGFKNATSGDVQVAIDACGSSCNPHSFLSVSKQGLAAIVHTKGNLGCHVILRGGANGPNFSAEHVKGASELMAKKKLAPR